MVRILIQGVALRSKQGSKSGPTPLPRSRNGIISEPEMRCAGIFLDTSLVVSETAKLIAWEAWMPLPSIPFNVRVLNNMQLGRSMRIDAHGMTLTICTVESVILYMKGEALSYVDLTITIQLNCRMKVSSGSVKRVLRLHSD